MQNNTDLVRLRYEYGKGYKELEYIFLENYINKLDLEILIAWIRHQQTQFLEKKAHELIKYHIANIEK